MRLKRIYIIGPESTGKSTLAAQLANHYNTLWCPEYAREYLEKNGADYSYEDLLLIAKGQLQLEEKYVQQLIAKTNQDHPTTPQPPTSNNEPPTSNLQLPASNLLFLDTDMHVMRVWSEFVFDKCHLYILDKLAQQKADLYLLCNTDLPWVTDELREYPDIASRIHLFTIYKNMMENQDVTWKIISGSDPQKRFEQAVAAVESIL